MSKIKIFWLTLLLLVLSAITYFALNHEAWLQNFNQERQAQQANQTQKGRLFGEQANQDQCLAQTFTQFGSCLGFECTVNQGVYLKSCLSTAAPSRSFCDGVPQYSEKLSTDAKQWLKDRCWDKEVNGEGCRFLLKQQIYFCDKQQ